METTLQQIYGKLNTLREEDSFGDLFVEWLLENKCEIIRLEKEFLENVFYDGIEEEYQFHVNGIKQDTFEDYYNNKFRKK